MKIIKYETARDTGEPIVLGKDNQGLFIHFGPDKIRYGQADYKDFFDEYFCDRVFTMIWTDGPENHFHNSQNIPLEMFPETDYWFSLDDNEKSEVMDFLTNAKHHAMKAFGSTLIFRSDDVNFSLCDCCE